MYQRFIDACKAGNLGEVQKIYENCAQDERQAMLKAKNIYGYDYAALRSAAGSGLLEVVRFLWEKCDKYKRQEMLASDNYYAFRLAVENGHLEVVKFFWENCAQDKRQEMLASGNYYALRSAAENGHLEVVKFFWEKCPEDKRQEMLASEDYEALCSSAENGHLDVVKFFWEKCDKNKRQEMLKAKDIYGYDYAALRSAAYNGHFHVLDWLLSVAEEKMRTEIYPKLQNQEFSQKLVLQREEIIKKEPELDIDKFNSQLTHFFKNPTLSRMLLTCKNLPEGLRHSLQFMKLFAETANFIAGKKYFDSGLLETIKAAQATTHGKLGKAVNTLEFFIACRQLKFALREFEDKTELYI